MRNKQLFTISRWWWWRWWWWWWWIDEVSVRPLLQLV